MALRFPRRTFANPVVLTLALPLSACTVSSAPPPRQPEPINGPYNPPASPQAVSDPQPQTVAVANPPRSTPQPDQPPPKVVVVANPPRPTTSPTPEPQPQPKPVVVANPPRPQPTPTKPNVEPDTMTPPPKQLPTTTTADRHWNVSRHGNACTVFSNDACRTTSPARTMPPCNPPPPVAYQCPAGLADGASLAIIQHANSTECFTVVPEFKCPANAKCRKLDPQKIACP